MANSPTTRSLAHLRERGYVVAVVERWNPYARIRQDLFGFGDLLALGDDEVIIVQTTSSANMAARIAKITEHPNLPAVRRAGIRIVVHGWRKSSAGTWTLRETDIS